VFGNRVAIYGFVGQGAQALGDNERGEINMFTKSTHEIHRSGA
jgi:hypothetical protein